MIHNETSSIIPWYCWYKIWAPSPTVTHLMTCRAHFLTPLCFLHPPSKVSSLYFLPPLVQEFQALFKSPGYSCQLHIYNCLNCNFRINLRAFWQVNRKPMFGTTKFWIFMIFHRFHISNCPWLDDNSVVC